jgi:hypothetical protein
MSETLYRFTDENGRLLYVGISSGALRRFTQHQGDKGWWREVTDIGIEHYETRAEVVAAERAAILTESPAYNVQHNANKRRAAAVADELVTAEPKVEMLAAIAMAMASFGYCRNVSFRLASPSLKELLTRTVGWARVGGGPAWLHGSLAYETAMDLVLAATGPCRMTEPGQDRFEPYCPSCESADEATRTMRRLAIAEGFDLPPLTYGPTTDDELDDLPPDLSGLSTVADFLDGRR